MDFDADIFGIASSRATLDASDVLSNTVVTCRSRGARGFDCGDTAKIDFSNSRRLLFDATAGTFGDQARVFAVD